MFQKSKDNNNDGRGYVWAIWHFHTEEIYASNENPLTGSPKLSDTQYRQNRANLEKNKGNKGKAQVYTGHPTFF